MRVTWGARGFGDRHKLVGALTRFQRTNDPISAQIGDAAQTLANYIEAGAYSELTSDGRAELRCLTMAMASWAGQVEALEVERLPARRRIGGLRLAIW